jgi:hypothetical protein
MDHLIPLRSGNVVAAAAERADLLAQEMLAGRCVRLVTTRASLVNGAVPVLRFGGGVVVAFKAELNLLAC